MCAYIHIFIGLNGMKRSKQKLLLEQVDKKLEVFKAVSRSERPEKGWINTIRLGLGMTYEQLSKRMNFQTRLAVRDLEKREANGSITLNSLSDAANSLNMRLVYGFIPQAGSLQAMIEERAEELAREIVMKTSHTMTLEDQALSKERLIKAVEERKAELLYERPKYLWD